MILVEFVSRVKDNRFLRLDEVKRLELVTMARDNRYHSRSTKVKYKYINADAILSGSPHLDVTLEVADHKVVMRFENFMTYFKRHIKSSKILKGLGKSQLDELKPAQIKTIVTSATVFALDSVDMRVNCDCADFAYRFSYIATQKKYNLDFEENRPATRTNPNNKGSVCKHLAGALTSPSRYQLQVVRDLTKLLIFDDKILK